MKKVLHLTSWYPNKTGVLDGDFIQRHIKAISLLQLTEVIHVVKDTKNIPRGRKIEKNRTSKLNETIVYYHPLQFGISFIDKAISFVCYWKFFVQEIKHFIQKEGRPDLIHVHVAFKAGLLALWVKRKYKVPFIVTEHWTGYQNDDPNNYSNKSFFFRHYTRKIIEQAISVTSVSENLSQRLGSIFRIRHSSVIYNAVNCEYFFYRPHQPKKFRFIHISSMDPQKNIEGLLTILSRLKQIRQDWECIMVGPTKGMYQELASALNLDDYLEWKGQIEYPDVAKEMQESSALLMFSKYENLPCVICEALCCGLPVISSDVGGIREIVTEKNGKLVEEGNEDQFLKIIAEMIDSPLTYNSAEIAAEAVDKFNYTIIAKKFMSLYDYLVKF